MKRRLKKIIPTAIVICIVCLLLTPFAFILPRYKIPENSIKISASYRGDSLIILCNKCFRTYGIHGETVTDLPAGDGYKDFCAVSSDDIIFLDLKGNAIHYTNGNFERTKYHNIKSVCYVVGSYLFLDETGNVYNEDGLVCTLKKAERLLGSAEANFALKNIMYSDERNLYNYNMRSDETECLKNCTEAEINMCGALMIVNGKLFGFSAPDYKFKQIEYDKNAEITHITSRIQGYGYLLLNKNGKIEALGFDSSGNLIKNKKISSTSDLLLYYYNPMRNDLSYCQEYVRFVNGISSVDNIYSSPSGSSYVNQQLIFIQSGGYIFLYY